MTPDTVARRAARPALLALCGLVAAHPGDDHATGAGFAAGVDEAAVRAANRVSPVYVCETPVRLWHWVNALAIFVLAVTSRFIGSPLPTMPGEASANCLTSRVRFAHFAAACVLFFRLPAHPVRFLDRHVLEPLGLTQSEVARRPGARRPSPSPAPCAEPLSKSPPDA